MFLVFQMKSQCGSSNGICRLCLSAVVDGSARESALECDEMLFAIAGVAQVLCKLASRLWLCR